MVSTRSRRSPLYQDYFNERGQPRMTGHRPRQTSQRNSTSQSTSTANGSTGHNSSDRFAAHQRNPNPQYHPNDTAHRHRLPDEYPFITTVRPHRRRL